MAFLSAQKYWEELNRLNGEVRKTQHEDYMDFAELYGDYVAAYEQGKTDSYLEGLRTLSKL